MATAARYLPLILRLVTVCVVLLVWGARTGQTHAQAPAGPELLTPVDNYRGTGTGSQELQRFHAAEFESGNIAWIIIGSLASLFLIAPGLLLFYCGLLQTRNPNTVMVRYVGLVALLSMTWVLWIYSLAFARNASSYDVRPGERLTVESDTNLRDRLLGGTDHFVMRGLEAQLGDDAPQYPLRRRSDSVPHLLFMTYQLMFFLSVPIPLVVALTGRLTAAGIALFVVLWGTIVYAPTAYWVWGGGWHAAVLDTAGGIPAHISVGFSALAAAWMLRRTNHHPEGAELTHRLVYLVLGMTLFWCGTLIGSASRSLSADGYAVNTFVSTFLAGCAGLIGWAGIDWLARDKTGLTGYCVGPLIGLVTIAAPSGYVVPQSSIVIGLLGGAVGCQAYRTMKRRCPGNGLLVVFSLHAIGGVLGIMLTGIFATPSVAGYDQQGTAIAGLLAGDPGRLAGQAWATASAAAVATIGTVVALIIVRVAGGIRGMKTSPEAQSS